MKFIDTLASEPIVLAQISDSHLFAELDGLHHGHNVLTNLKGILISIRDNPAIDYVVFTGDLTQDHTEQSYQNFVNAVHECKLELPIYYLAGNHDELELLAKYFADTPFVSDKAINHPHWQIQLIDSKSTTPAGFVSEQALINLEQGVDGNKQQLIMMHHHPIDVGYFIDKHGLENKAIFWQAINEYDNIAAIACGHVHGAMTLKKTLTKTLTKPSTKSLIKQSVETENSVAVYTCPATSIQFDPEFDGVSALAKGPGYRVFYLYPDGQLNTDIVYL